MQRTIMFAGPLADRFTHDRFRLDCDDLLTLMSGLEANFPGFKGELLTHRDVAFVKVRDGKLSSVTEELFPMNFGSADTLVVSAAEDGSAMAAFTYVAEALEAYGASAAVATAVAAIAYVAVSVAIAYASSAVMKSLSKSKDTSSSTKEQNASALYNGAQNIVEQGGAIPLIYGRHRVGGTIISSEISTDRISILSPDTISVYAGQTVTKNVTSNDVLRQYFSITSWTVDNVGTFSPGNTYTTGTGSSAMSVTLAADGTFTFVTNTGSGGSITGTYTGTDGLTGNTVTTTFNASVITLVVLGNSDTTWTPEIA